MVLLCHINAGHIPIKCKTSRNVFKACMSCDKIYCYHVFVKGLEDGLFVGAKYKFDDVSLTWLYLMI